jgi:transcriptional regulator with XRE-family HTH domain
MDHLADNLRRLIGLHALKVSTQNQTGAAALIGVSAQALSELQSGTRQPSLRTVQRIAAFFEIPMDRIIEAPFEELLAHELTDPERFQRVEAKRHGPASPHQK